LRDQFAIHVQPVSERTWRVGLRGADARSDAVGRLITGFDSVLKEAA
jgi:hypothetical protein